MGRGPPVLQYQWSAVSDAERQTSLDGLVDKVCADLGVPGLPGHRKYGDDHIHAWLLLRYLARGKYSTGSTHWVMSAAKYLPKVVAHIRRSLAATKADASQGHGTLVKKIAGDMEKPFPASTDSRTIDMFHQCIYAAGFMNLAFVQGIGHASNINGAAPTLLSQGSLFDSDGLRDVPYVTFDRIENIPRDAGTGARHMISGLTPLSVRIMSEAHLFFSGLDSWVSGRDSLRTILEYPFRTYER